MSSELYGVLIGGLLGITASLLMNIVEVRRRSRSIKAVAAAEITAIKEKAERFINGESTLKEFNASTPVLTSIATELGFLSPKQAIAFRRVVTLDMEMRTTGNKEKIHATIKVCKQALKYFPGNM
jgi:hypothetical protein